MPKLTFQRVQGADSEPLDLDIDMIEGVAASIMEGRCILALPGRGVLVKGTVEEVQALIDAARAEAQELDEDDN
ncbi:hypothetical protein [Spirosoma areae]